MQIVLVGNANSGKTSLFNLLTGARQHVGNWPGVTVEKKEGFLELGKELLKIVDLPGIYTLDPNTVEQKLSRDYLFSDEPKLAVNILDATNMERSLYLTLQLREQNIPMIVALNMMDEVKASGIKIDLGNLSAMLGVPVVGISATKGLGISELKKQISLYIEGKTEIKPFITGCSDCNKCREGVKRYRIIDNIMGICTGKQEKPQSKGRLTEILDKVLLNRYLAIPVFLFIMLGIFIVTFGSFTTRISDYIEYFLNSVLREQTLSLFDAMNVPKLLTALICDGIIPGIGAVLVFLPQISMLFILMSFLEDSGYMSRAAFIMDKLFSGFGLTGSSFIPLLMGFGCTVPAIMACRILPSEKDRKLTIMLTSFMSCSARLPVYVLMTGIFFKGYGGLVLFLIYMLGIAVAILTAFLMNALFFKKQSGTFVMEIPPYRAPKLRNLILHTWEKVKGFLVKAGTTLLAASVIIWFLQSFTPGFAMTDNPSKSILAAASGFIAPLFAPLGFGTWQAATALLTGVAAKEMIVSTFSILFSANGKEGLLFQAVQSHFSTLSAFSFMVFILLYLPCISAIITMKKEYNSLKWTAGTLVFSFSAAWVISFLIYSAGRILGF